MQEKIRTLLEQNTALIKSVARDCAQDIEKTAQLIIAAYKQGNKVLIFGNGGSAADSQHIAAELVGRFKKERPALPALALTTNTSIISALANDYSYDLIFERQIEAWGKKGDIAIGISTSGSAKNVIRALKKSRERGLYCVGFTGEKGKELKPLCDICVIVPSADTARIQEAHITVAHIICELVEEALSA
ncbi:MAG: D-sedoheptulose 7-phosphate isomerase [Candidatus Omnitrophica bacterium]|nr:D-sedoheptulose 7-phosphate isomerase [Candidatus Omnitrophota bacterium]MBU1925083.1 D-sedoheptulose 7-phosphate isomerase [Candidatus Omnitrophota bacterium]